MASIPPTLDSELSTADNLGGSRFGLNLPTLCAKSGVSSPNAPPKRVTFGPTEIVFITPRQTQIMETCESIPTPQDEDDVPIPAANAIQLIPPSQWSRPSSLPQQFPCPSNVAPAVMPFVPSTLFVFPSQASESSIPLFDIPLVPVNRADNAPAESPLKWIDEQQLSTPVLETAAGVHQQDAPADLICHSDSVEILSARDDLKFSDSVRGQAERSVPPAMGIVDTAMKNIVKAPRQVIEESQPLCFSLATSSSELFCSSSVEGQPAVRSPPVTLRTNIHQGGSESSSASSTSSSSSSSSSSSTSDSDSSAALDFTRVLDDRNSLGSIELGQRMPVTTDDSPTQALHSAVSASIPFVPSAESNLIDEPLDYSTQLLPSVNSDLASPRGSESTPDRGTGGIVPFDTSPAILIPSPAIPVVLNRMIMPRDPSSHQCVLCLQSFPPPVLHSGYYLHIHCALWAPEIYYDALTGAFKNIAAAIARSKDIKCALCRHVGASIGCLEPSCERSYHFHCAVGAGCALNPPLNAAGSQEDSRRLPQCVFCEGEHFAIRCPLHFVAEHSKRKRSRSDSTV